ncbi:hypothetical protein NX059_005389 [Plenodomus lindquistii]|nr:hypothetical protein NX059_005389 [Plenodomus lindquistii]
MARVPQILEPDAGLTVPARILDEINWQMYRSLEFFMSSLSVELPSPLQGSSRYGFFYKFSVPANMGRREWTVPVSYYPGSLCAVFIRWEHQWLSILEFGKMTLASRSIHSQGAFELQESWYRYRGSYLPIMRLPIELRLEIYEHVFMEDLYLASTVGAQQCRSCRHFICNCPNTGRKLVFKGFVPRAPRSWLVGTHDPADEVPAATRLDLVCKTIRNEISKTFERRYRSKARKCFGSLFDLQDALPLIPPDTLRRVALNFTYRDHHAFFKIRIPRNTYPQPSNVIVNLLSFPNLEEVTLIFHPPRWLSLTHPWRNVHYPLRPELKNLTICQ